jgi:CspA family cold shock protein
MRGMSPTPSREYWSQFMANGTIKTLQRDKGFGFIKDDKTDKEFFFHRSACEYFLELGEGDQVTYEAGQGPKGPRAEDVRKA